MAGARLAEPARKIRLQILYRLQPYGNGHQAAVDIPQLAGIALINTPGHFFYERGGYLSIDDAGPRLVSF